MTEQDMWNIARCVVADAFEKQSILDHEFGRTEQANRTKQVAKEMRDLIPHGPLGLPATEPINPDEAFWNSLERNLTATYHGGYHSTEELEIYRHGMNTVFNYLRANSKNLFGGVVLREQVETLTTERDEARKELSWFKDRLGEIAKYGRVQE